MPQHLPPPAQRRVVVPVSVELTWAQALSVSREVRPGASGELRVRDVADWVRSLVRAELRDHTPPPGPIAPARRLEPRDLEASPVVQAFDRECRSVGALRGRLRPALEVCRIHLVESVPGHRVALRTACGVSVDGLGASCHLLPLVDCSECLAVERELGSAWKVEGFHFRELEDRELEVAP